MIFNKAVQLILETLEVVLEEIMIERWLVLICYAIYLWNNNFRSIMRIRHKILFIYFALLTYTIVKSPFNE